MVGFRVTRTDFVRHDVWGATSYVVNDEGALVLSDGDSVVEVIDAGRWIEVQSIGNPLCHSWPPEDFDPLFRMMGNLGFCDAGAIEPWLYDPWFNDVDSLTDALILADYVVWSWRADSSLREDRLYTRTELRGQGLLRERLVTSPYRAGIRRQVVEHFRQVRC
jgi:hypothetical protein